MPTIISDARSFRADRAWGARDIAEIEGASVRLHWTDQPYKWHGPDSVSPLNGSHSSSNSTSTASQQYGSRYPDSLVTKLAKLASRASKH